ncbi:MAG: DUF296 domain-containing protein [Bacillota bacterium]|nr:DUF296 domain-containing protein [Bacillota bacterium]
MQYREGTLGRVFVVKIEDGDDLIESIKSVAIDAEIKTASFMMLGALKEAMFVSGPKEPVLPPEQVWKSFSDGREIMGIGTLYKNDHDPSIHLHISVGKGDEAHVGCLRENGQVYIVVEVVIFEICGIIAEKIFDKKTGQKMLNFIN